MFSREYVRTSRDATMGRSGLGLLRDDKGRAPQRWRSEGLYNEYHRSRRRTGPDELTRYSIGTTARPTLGGFSFLHIIGTDPG
jgi:hypothetical protein